MDLRQFSALVDEIMAQGFNEETASKYAAILGDIPVRDGSGNILVIDHETGHVLAKLRALKFYGE